MLEVLEDRLAPAQGILDPGFGQDGKVFTDISTSGDHVSSVAIDGQGRVVAAGTSYNGNDYDFAVARYNPNGSLDTSFGNGGEVTTSFFWQEFAYGVVIDGQGRIVVVGTTNNAGNNDFAVVRYNPDGSLDPSFGTGGKVTTAIGSRDDIATSLTLDGQGRIVVAGYSWNSSDKDVAVARYNVDGSLDTSFGTGGKVVTGFGASNEEANSVAIDGQGRIVVAGYSDSSGTKDFALVRYTATGSLDPSFGTGGKVVTAIGASNEEAISMAIDGQGRIVAAGTSNNGNNFDFALARYTANGSLDTSFDGDGKLTAAFGPSDDVAKSVMIDSRGNIVAAGYSSNGSDDNFAVARYNPDGSPDATFDADGKVTTAFGPSNDGANGAVIDGQGRIVVAGYTNNGGNYDFAVARYAADGRLDGTFDGDGKAVTDFAGYSAGRRVVVDGQGRLVVAGTVSYGVGADFALTRYNPDGSLDIIFGIGGRVTTDFSGRRDEALALAIDSQGRIVVAGRSIAGDSDFAVARYKADGSLDLTFGTQGRVTTDLGGADDEAVAVAIDSQGRIVVAGSRTSGGLSDFALARYNPDGTLDGTFDSDGWLTTDFGASDAAAAVAIDGSGRIVVAGGRVNGGLSGFFALARYNANGSLDVTFDGDGKLTTDVGYGTASDLAIDGQGRIVAAGYAVVNGSYDFAVVRYNPNGSLDGSFDSDGKVTTDFGGTYDVAAAVAIDNIGRIVVCGGSANVGGNDLALARYNADGSLDTAFGAGGKLTTDFGSPKDIATGVVIDGQNRIVVAGMGNLAIAVARYAADGRLDGTFDGDGKAVTDFAGYSAGRRVVVDGQGRLVVAGTVSYGVGSDFALTRYNPNGSLDTAFGIGGRVTTDFSGRRDEALALAIDSQGRIVVAGRSSSNGSSDFALARYNADGSLDPSFGTQGRVTTDLSGADDEAFAVAIDSRGRIVVAGSRTSGGLSDFAVARYNLDGTLDGTFDSDGWLTTDFGATDGASAVAIDGSDRIVVAGGRVNGGLSGFFALARYNADGSLDTAFGAGGKLTTDVGYGTAIDLVIDGQGRIVAAGYAVVNGSYDFALVRYSADGSLDGSFDSDGKLTTDFGGTYDVAAAVAIDNIGRIVVCGGSANGGDNDFALARYNADGSLDTAFGAGGKLTTDFGSPKDIATGVVIDGQGRIVVAGMGNGGFAIARYRSDYGRVWVDPAGNTYVTGMFEGTADFDPGPGVRSLTSVGRSDAFVAKYDVAGTLQWVRSFGGSGEDAGVDVTTDAQSHVYVLGNFQGTATLPVIGGCDVFVSKLNAAGDFQWTRSLGGTGNDYGNAIAVDGIAVYLTGSFQGKADFDRQLLTSVGTQDAFVCKLDLNGNRVWAKRAGGSAGDEVGNAVAVDAMGAVYVAGAFSGEADFDPEDRRIFDLTSAGQRDAFVWKLDSAGQFLWARAAGGSGDDVATALALFATEVYATGTFTGTADFDPSFTPVEELVSAGAADVFVWKLNSAGAFAWARSLGGEGNDGGTALIADSRGVYVAGSFEATADFDPGPGKLTLPNQGGSDTFLARLNLSGDCQYARALGMPGNDQARGLGITSGGEVVLAGGFYRPGVTPPAGAQVMSGGSLGNLFVIRSTTTDNLEPNDTRLAATDLGAIDTHRLIDHLSLHASTDEDWFRFDLASLGAATNVVRIDFVHTQGDLTLELYDATGLLLASSDTQADYEQISLENRPAGVYFVHVFGLANPSYQLTFDVPAVPALDRYEPNDTLQKAWDLGSLEDTKKISNLSMPAHDVDYFKFTTVAPGTLYSQVRIDFHHALGDLDLVLYDALGNQPLRQARGAGDSEVISLNGLPAGAYFVQVVGPSGGNRLYRLTIEPPIQLRPDEDENNQTAATATPLGIVQGDNTWDHLSIDSSTDEDWFSFSTVRTGGAGDGVAINFDHTRGDLDLQLYRQNNSDPPVLVSSAMKNQDREQLSLQGLLAGTYFIRAFGYQKATNPSYQLRIDAPTRSPTQPDQSEGVRGNNSFRTASRITDEGANTLSGTRTLTELNLDSATDIDWFTFTTVGMGGLGQSLQLKYDSTVGNLDLQLYRVVNNVSYLLGTSQGMGGIEVYSLKGLAAGTYYARVYSPGRATGAYSLTLDTPTPANRDDWTVLVYMTATNLVDRAFADLNEMEQAAAALPGSVNLAVLLDQSAAVRTFATGNGSQPAWGTVGRALITPDTDVNTVATRFELMPEQDTGNSTTLQSFVQWAIAAAPARHYALILWDHGGGLDGFNFDRNDGLTADWLTPTKVVTALAGLPRMDLVAFDSCLMATAEVAYALRDVTDVVVASQDVVPGTGFDYTTALAPLATDPGNMTGEGLASGMVDSYAQQYRARPDRDTLSAVRTAKLDPLTVALQQFATEVGKATEEERKAMTTVAAATLLPYSEALDQRDLGDFFTLVANDATLADALKSAAQTILLRLDEAIIKRTADAHDNSGLSIYLPVRPTSEPNQVAIMPGSHGNYSNDFHDFITATGWFEVLTELARDPGNRSDTMDSYDLTKPNGSRSEATDLKRLSGTGNVNQGLSLHNAGDVDWYRFEVEAAAGDSLTVQVNAKLVGTSPLSVSLYDKDGQSIKDAAGQPLELSLTTGQSGLLNVAGLPPAVSTFHLKFWSGAGVPSYSFIINAPGSGPDWTGTNGTAAKAYPLVGPNGSRFFGLSLKGGEIDWFRFDTPGLSNPDLQQLTVEAGTGSLAVQIRDASGTVVGAAHGSETLAIPYTRYGAGEGYTVVVINPGDQPVPYSLRFTTAEDSGTSYPLDRFDRAVLTAGGTWVQTGSPTIQAGRAVFSGAANERLLWQGWTAADAGVQARVTLPPLGNATATLLARATVDGGKLTAYEARLVRLNGVLTAQLFRTINGVSVRLGQSAPLGRRLDGLLRLEAVGQRLRLLVDGRSLVEVTDSVVGLADQVGVAGIARVAFDDFLVGELAVPLPVSVGDATTGAGAAWQPVAGTVQAQEQTLTAGGAAVAVYTPAQMANVAMTARYALHSGQTVGLVARYTGAGASRSYYQGQLTLAAGGTVTAALVRVQGATTFTLPMLVTAPTIPASGQMRLEVQGAVLRLLVDGAAMAVARDTVLARPGQVGVSLGVGAALTGFTANALTALASPTVGTPVFADGFDRLDGSNLGPPWVERAGDLTLAGGRLVEPSGGRGLAVWQELPLQNVMVAALVDLSAAGQAVGLMARYRERLGYYEGRLTNNGDGTVTAAIYRVSNGVATLRLSARWTVATSGLAQFEVTGSTLRLRLGGQMLTVLDTVLTGPGLAGIALTDGALADDFTVTAG